MRHRSWSQGRRVRVGALVVGAGALFLALLTFILGSGTGAQMRTHTLLFDESVKGLVVGSRVNFQGVPAGSVTDIRFQNGRTAVVIAIDPTVAPIQDVTRGRLDRALVTGQVTVELEGWRPDGHLLPDGVLIEPAPSTYNQIAKTMPELLQEGGELMHEARALLGNLNALCGPDNRARLTSLLDHLDAATAGLAGQLDGTIADARRTAAALARTSDAIADLTAGDDVRQAVQSARRAADRLDALSAKLVNVADELTVTMSAGRQPLLRMLTNAQDALAGVRDLARRLELAPSSLLFGTEARELSLPAAPGEGR